MKKLNLTAKSREQLLEIAGLKRAAIRALRFKLAASALKNVRSIRKGKKDLARILTKLNNYE